MTTLSLTFIFKQALKSSKIWQLRKKALALWPLHFMCHPVSSDDTIPTYTYSAPTLPDQTVAKRMAHVTAGNALLSGRVALADTGARAI